MRHGGLVALAATVPLLLLHQTEDLRMLTRIERDGSGLKLVWARADPSRAREVRTRLREATPGYEDERHASEGSAYVISRSWRPTTLRDMPDTKLETVDLPQRLVSLYNEYSWEEKVTIHIGPATSSEKAGAAQATMLYILQTPGRVDEASVMPLGQVTGDTVVWRLTGDKEEYTLQARSRMLRWDMLLLLVYVAAAFAAMTAQWAVRRARTRPRRI